MSDNPANCMEQYDLENMEELQGKIPERAILKCEGTLPSGENVKIVEIDGKLYFSYR